MVPDTFISTRRQYRDGVERGQELAPVNGVVTLVIPEGQKTLQFALRALDLSADATVAVVAQLVDSLGTPTHLEHQEATITAVDTPAINYINGLTTQTYSGTVARSGCGRRRPVLVHLPDHDIHRCR